MPRRKKDDGSKSTKSGGRKPAAPAPESPATPESPPAQEPEPEPNAPTPELNRPQEKPPRTRKELEAKREKEGGVSTSTDGRRARPPLKDGKPDVDQATHWTKDPATKLRTFFWANGARVREDEIKDWK